MREEKNIDRLFQENLKEFEVFPPNKAWNKIEQNLIPVPKKSIFNTKWFRIASVAAVILCLFTVSTIYLLPKENFANSYFTYKDSVSTIFDKELDENLIDGKKVVENKKTTIVKPKVESNFESNVNIENAEEIVEKTSSEFETKTLPKLDIADVVEKEQNAAKKQLNLNKEESKFTVATIYAPIYLNSFGDGSGVGEQFGDSPISGNSSHSYGLKFAYQLSDKFSVQSGINLLSMGYTTDNVHVTSGVSVVGFSNLSAQPLNNLTAKSGGENLEEKALNSVGSVNQVFGYVEIPIELKYNVADGKLGVNVVGGFSTLLLNRDEVFVETNSLSQSLGESNNLRSINFSGNLGLDVDYSIRKNLYINVSPMLKVQTNTFSKNSGSVLPYYLGVYTGLNYKF
ncbi:hypothetical protein R3X25_05295 [Lutibacter sp. TH_r2]|uniref:outer membrane beta-barrel protein n=1 Tax=Lutibacter sp. TH_r2 TaxID=3082083 RepID=UPI0029555A61|nr:hypothetical protein [Lutibacter sp. TH_r2]MDV7186689.1 hypothetical protein [Lutibacter sp. TH_r2]